ncbi:Pkinase domain-containing protein [Cephalotus follicularis]|uniref:Pkinase domain-containing protein n=1 Tax=Cephalotus follicularis TaxID=3775 RepID=A0A1Q3DG28_CEPFO|nr:Pkinase domain-containing protein [Cephalotus follicularis]
MQFFGSCKDPLMVIVTELLPGMSLRKYLVGIRPNQLNLRVALKFSIDIARAMECLHANGIIHRDLKPDNLLPPANQKSVKLADFGLAREESVTEMMTTETGTYHWMAPEVRSFKFEIKGLTIVVLFSESLEYYIDIIIVCHMEDTERLLYAASVDMVLAGHVHAYERSIRQY